MSGRGRSGEPRRGAHRRLGRPPLWRRNIRHRQIAQIAPPFVTTYPTPPAGIAAPETPLAAGRVLRYVYVARLAFASAIFVAALTRWLEAAEAQKLFASVSLVLAMGFTAASVVWSEVWERPLTRTFRYLQVLFDLVLVSAIVASTGGPSSPFAAVYVLVIAVAALWLPVGGSLLVAGLGCALYVFVTFAILETRLEGAVLFQSAVFASVAIGSAFVSERLRRAGAGSEKLAEELVQVRLQAADVLRALDSGVLTVDGAGRLLYANPAASRLLDMPLDMRLGRPVQDLLATRAPALAAVLVRAARDGHRAQRADAEVATDARTFAIGVTTTAVGEPEARTATAIFADIADQRRLEQLRLSAQRLEAVAELSASLAHEIRNPLAAIRSAVEQLAARARANDDEQALAALVMRESDRLSRLLSEFLDFARVREARMAPVDIAGLLRHVADVIRQHPDRHEHTTILAPPASATCQVNGDEDLLVRAVLNLALNAVQAMPEGGTLTLRYVVPPDPMPPEAATLASAAVAIVVEDTGPGLAQEVRERIFQPFITTKIGGHGLGLPVAHRAVEAHRGVIAVESGPTGTRFTLCLPRSPQLAA
jgi:two-component system, NtrC family, sensor histidine kinase PilS